MYLILLLTSTIGIILFRKKKIGKLLLVLSIIILPFSVFALIRYELPIKIKIVEVKGVFEEYTVEIESLEDRQIKYGEKPGTLSSQEKEGYTFNGYVDKDGNEVDENTIVTGPMEITPVFTPITYTIIIDYDEGEGSNPSTYTIEDVITLNNPTNEDIYNYFMAGSTNVEADKELIENFRNAMIDKY